MESLKIGDRLRLKVIQINNAGSFWARPVVDGSGAGDQYEELKHEINRYFQDFSTQKVPTKNPVNNQICIARRNSDKLWYRVRIEDRIGNSSFYSCFMLDEGQVEPFNKEWLRESPSHFTRVPLQAVQFKLAGIKPLSPQASFDLTITRKPAKRWDPIATSITNKHLKGEKSHPEVEVMHVQSNDVVHVRVFVGEERLLCLNDELVRLKHAYVTESPVASESSSDETAAKSRLPNAVASNRLEYRMPALASSEDHVYDNQQAPSIIMPQPAGISPRGRGLQNIPASVSKAFASNGPEFEMPSVASSEYTVHDNQQAPCTIMPQSAGMSQRGLVLQNFPARAQEPKVGLMQNFRSAPRVTTPPRPGGRGLLALAKMNMLNSVKTPRGGIGRGEPLGGGPAAASASTGRGTSPLLTLGRGSPKGTPPSPGRAAQIQALLRKASPKVGKTQDQLPGITPLADNAVKTVQSPKSPKNLISPGHRSRNALLNALAASADSSKKSTIGDSSSLKGNTMKSLNQGQDLSVSEYDDMPALEGFPDNKAPSAVEKSEPVAEEVPGPLLQPEKRKSISPDRLTNTQPSIAPLNESPNRTSGNMDSHIQPLESRLPKFAKQKGRVGAKNVQTELWQSSRSDVIEVSEDGVIIDTSSDLAGKHSYSWERIEQGPISMNTIAPWQTQLFDDDDYTSPENDDVQIYSKRQDYLDKLERTQDSDTNDMSVNYFPVDNMPTNDELGVLLDGIKPRFIQNTKMMFDSTMNKVIDRMDLVPSNLQSYCWPALQRLCNVVGLSSTFRPAAPTGGVKQGGTTLAYLVPLVDQLRQKNLYSGVPAGVGPLALILCSSWKGVQTVYQQLHQLLGRDIVLRFIPVYGAGCEENQEVNLINGCDLMIATPKCLLRLMDRGIVEVKRLCHMVLDDGDKLVQRQMPELREILTRYEDCLETEEDNRTAPTQIILMGKHWSQDIRTFMDRHIPNATVVIASMAEAAIYCQVKKVVHVLHADQRLAHLGGLFEASDMRKTIIFTNCAFNALTVYEALESFSISAILCTEDSTPMEQDRALQDWKGPSSPGSPTILVMSDQMLVDTWQRDAELIIHYDPPSRRDYYGPRLWCMYKNFEHPLQPSEEPKDPTSILLITEHWKPYISLIMKDLRNSGQHIPETLTKLADSLISEKERNKYTNLCREFKAFGRCSTGHGCSARHSIQQHLDAPGAQAFHQSLPSNGNVKVLVTCVGDATRLWVRLLEHDAAGTITDYRSNYTEFCCKMHMHYSKEDHRMPCDYPEVDQLYVVEDMQHTYNRVKVIHVKKKYHTMVVEEVTVRLVDVGSVKVVNPQDLLVMDPSFRDIPFQAVEVYACGVKPIDDDNTWTNCATDHVFNLVHAKQLDGRIVLALGNTLWLDPLVERKHLKEVGTVVHSVAVHKALLNADLAVSNPEHMKLLHKACDGNIYLPDILVMDNKPHMAFDAQGMPTVLRTASLPESGLELAQVEVTAVLHPGLFYARLQSNIKKLHELHEQIRIHVKLNPPSEVTLKSVKLGSLVLATSPLDPEDECRLWYRGKVLSIEDDQYDIFFLDTGESEFVVGDQVRPLPSIFTHWPFQAIECCLPHIAPTNGDEWSEETGDPLWFLVADSGETSKPLLAEVVDTEKAQNIGMTKFAVRLFDTNAEFDIDIAQELVTHGHARPLSEMIQAEMPPVNNDAPVAYAHVPALCAELLLTLNNERQVDLVYQIQKAVRASQDDVEGMSKHRVVGALCRALGYLSNMAIVELLCKLLILLTKLHPGVFEAILKDDGVTTLCRILARNNTEGHKVITNTISELVQQQKLREQFVDRGILRLLSVLLYNVETEDPETIKYALVSMREVLAALTERYRTTVLRSGCIEALCHQLENSTDNANIINCLHALKAIFIRVRVQEESRRWAMPVLCKHLKEAVDRPQFANYVVLTLCALSRGSRINKEALLEYFVLDALFSLTSSHMLNDEAHTECTELYDSLVNLKRKAKYTELPPPEDTVRYGLEKAFDLLESDDADEEDTTSSIPECGYQNMPIPKELLTTVLRTAHPEVNWFQDRHNLILLIQLKNVQQDLRVDIKPRDFEFGAVVEQVNFILKLSLFEEINPDRCETQVRPGEVRIGLRKVTPGNWPRVTYDRSKPPYLSPDFGRYIEDSESDSDSEINEEREKESPLELIERCKPRPRCLPVPPQEVKAITKVQPGHFHAFDPHDDPNYKSPSSEEEDGRIIDEQDEDLSRQFFDL